MEQDRQGRAPIHGLISSTSIEGFILQEYRFPPHHHVPRHADRLPVIALAFRGSYRESLAHGEQWRRSGDVSVMPAGEEHDERVGPDGAHAVLAYPRGGRHDGIRGCAAVLERWRRYRGASFAALSCRIQSEMRLPDKMTPLALEGLLLELVAEMSRLPGLNPSAPIPGWLEEARRLAEAHLDEAVTLAGVAQQVGVSRAHLARAFRRAYGSSLGEHRRRWRLERAARQLVQSRLPLAEIALDCGFCDQSHFSKSFRRRFRMTPGEFRRRG